MSISKELQEIYTGKKRDRIIETIEIYHEGTNTNEFLCKASSSLEIVLENGLKKIFKPANFIITYPRYEENETLDMSVSFGLVGFSILEQIEDILKNYEDNIIIYYRIYTENNLKAPQTSRPFKFTIKEISINNEAVSLNGSMLLNVSKMLPQELYTYNKFPMLRSLS